MLNSVNSAIICGFGRLGQNKAIDIMQTIAENKLNPLRYHLSPEAKKRLKWMYVVNYECDNNISLAALTTRQPANWKPPANHPWRKQFLFTQK